MLREDKMRFMTMFPKKYFILSFEGIYFIDFGYSEYKEDKLGSNPVTANQERIKSEHIQLCSIFGQSTPKEYE
ncbi:unnamed protein product [Debaryomyces tyrocola]|nr:unnamed protein product [Debaryomyces tyrocola]